MVMANDDGDAPIEATDSAQQKKEANAWYKKKMTRLKKVASTIKKVKDEKSADKAAAAIRKLYKEYEDTGRSNSSRFRVVAKAAPESEAMDAAAARYAPQLKKIRKQIRKNLERIDPCFQTAELDNALDAADIVDCFLEEEED